MRMNPALIAGKLFALALFALGPAGAAEIKVLSSNSMKTTLEELAPQFEASFGHKLAIRYEVMPTMKRQIDAGVAFRTSGCPGKFADDVSACDRPYGDSPPSNIASYPFAPNRTDLRKIRRQLRIVERKD